MTEKEKAKAYDEALERARKLYNSEETSADVEIACETIFPELAESEDEKIRKEIISHLQHEYVVKRYVSDVEYDRWIAWLEKQGKSKWNENDEHYWMMCVACVEECATQEREDFSKTIDWLKSLKQRMEEQQ